MAEIKSIRMQDGKVEISLSISRDEYRILNHQTSDLIVFPCGKEELTYMLTTGKLGNSNRIMVPKKYLQSSHVKGLDKKVPSKIFIIDGDAYLLIKIKRSELGMPKFEEKI